ncbi:MAG: DUF1643 domain-containing protein [Planctomycetes bacterium]|nr:DUF1643 domain-containing protein [Planctomycetota bacterium]
MDAGAQLDSTGAYRYHLWRCWNSGLSCVAFVMLNPSTADATSDDPTVRRCIGLARAWGHGRIDVVNLFAYRATNPAELCRVADPIGPENDDYLRRVVASVDRTVLAWGNQGRLHGRERSVLQLLAGAGPLHCLGCTKSGQPRHPLRVRSDVACARFAARPQA